MNKAIATLFYRLAQWLDPALYGRKEYAAIVRDLKKLKAVEYWIADPCSSSKYREALTEQRSVTNWDYLSTSEDFNFEDLPFQENLKEFPEVRETALLKPPKEVYKPLAPFESQEFQKLNSVFEKLRHLLNAGYDNAKKNEDSWQDFTRELIRFLNDIEASARGDLTVYIEPNSNIFPRLGAIGDSLNLILTNFRADIRSLPEDHPLRRKYKI